MSNKDPDKPIKKNHITSEFIKGHLSQSESIDEFDDFHSFEEGKRFRRRERNHLEEQEKVRVDQENERYAQDTKLRNKYAARVYWFMVCYTIFMAGVVVASGLQDSFEIGGQPLFFRLADLPLSTLIGGAFASAVGLVAFVVKGLFPQGHKENKS